MECGLQGLEVLATQTLGVARWGPIGPSPPPRLLRRLLHTTHSATQAFLPVSHSATQAFLPVSHSATQAFIYVMTLQARK